MNLKIKRLNPAAMIPRRATAESAGLDLCACIAEPKVLRPLERARIPIGIAIQLEPGTVGLVFPRSGLSSKFGITLANCVGVIDSDYRGEIQVPLTNLSETPYTIQPGDRIAQLAVMPVLLPEIEEVDSLTDSVRGENGFGSTGIHGKEEKKA